MIALTQEKREELKAFLSASIEKRCTVYTLAKQRELESLRDQIALVSLTACPVLYAVDSDVEDKIYTALCNENEDGAYPLFTAPPLPEIKLPHQLLDLINAVEFYHKVKAENPDPETGAWNDAYDWIKKASIEAAPVIKRLNGLGE